MTLLYDFLKSYKFASNGIFKGGKGGIEGGGEGGRREWHVIKKLFRAVD